MKSAGLPALAPFVVTTSSLAFATSSTVDGYWPLSEPWPVPLATSLYVHPVPSRLQRKSPGLFCSPGLGGLERPALFWVTTRSFAFAASSAADARAPLFAPWPAEMSA